MKNLKEKQFLVNMALSLGQVPDPALVKEISEHKALMDSITPLGDEFGELLAQLAQLKSEVETVKQVVEVKQQYFNPSDYPKPPTLEELMASVPEEVIAPKVERHVEEKPIVAMVKEKLSPPIAAASTSDPLTPLNQNFVTFEQLQKHYSLFINRIQQQISSIGGGGAVWLNDLNDVSFNSVKNANNGDILTYNAGNLKWEAAANTGSEPINPVFTYINNVLSSIAYGSGESKTFTYTNGALTRLDFVNGSTTVRKTFNYTGGVLTSITQVIL